MKGGRGEAEGKERQEWAGSWWWVKGDKGAGAEAGAYVKVGEMLAIDGGGRGFGNQASWVYATSVASYGTLQQ